MTLEKEFERLKRVLGMGSELKFLWLPNITSDVHGEVTDGVLKVYDADEDMALNTLRHEFVDYMISKQIIRPLVQQINLQNTLLDKLIYDRKEILIEKIFLLFENCQ